jgi:hypothetical protein
MVPDNFTRYLVNDTLCGFGQNSIHGSILGFEGQLAIF